MATAYHRRPVLATRDIAALAHTKIGNGSAWQGYYMFAGGRNPGPGLQETQATGYPNDLPEFSYDFHAPIDQSGSVGESAALLRAQHAFLSAFGDRLAGMTSTLPDQRPASSRDRATLRWALRSDGVEGFVVISHHQPYEGLEPVRGVQLRLEFDHGPVTVPSQAVDVSAGTLARWPVGLRIGGSVVRWATASAFTLLDGRTPTLVLVADAGIPVELAVGSAAATVVEPGDAPIDAGGLDILALPASDAPRLWVHENIDGERHLLRTDAELADDGRTLWVRSPSDAVEIERYDPASRAWTPCAVEPDASPEGAVPLCAAVALDVVRTAGEVPADHGFGGRRHRAPDAAAFESAAAVHTLAMPAWATDAAHDAVLEIEWRGDVAQLRVDGETVDDRFWDGTLWRVAVRDAGITAEGTVTLHVLPLSARSTIALPTAAALVREAAAPADLVRVTAVTVRARGGWRRVAV